MKRQLLYVILVFIISGYSCKKEIGGETAVEPSKKIAPDGFNFATSKTVDFNVRLLAANNQPIKGALVSVLIPSSTAEGVLFKAVSDNNGFVKGSFSVPSYLDTLQIEPNYPGVMSKAKAVISSNSVLAVIGGSKGYSGSIVPEPVPAKKPGQGSRILYYDGFSTLNFFYPSPYTSSADATTNNGVPNYLQPVPDTIDPTLLSFIAASLPNAQNVAVHHPQYINSASPASIDIVSEADVSVTFVAEGADYKNSLGFYTYPTNSPPSVINQAQLGNITLIFPNTSGIGSGGNLNAGDKVKIGHFSAGTSIGFVLMQDDWTGTDITFNKNPSEPTQKFYTTSNLNPEGSTDPGFAGVTNPKRHAVMLYDNIHHVFLFGFEDTHRTNQYINAGGNGADHDFNDLLFYATPDAAFDHTNVPFIDGGGPDDDGDGVPNSTDEFPTDPLRAYTQTTYWNTIAFEDLWPSTGDYDLNDLVVQYRYKYVKNAANNVVEFYGEYKPLAAGAYYKDGFAVEFPFAPGIVESVTGQLVTTTGPGKYITLASNGLETGQSKAVILPFDNFDKVLINASPADIFVNTVMALPKVTGTSVNVLVKFTTPVAISTVGDPSTFNPFIIPRLQRGYEVHLPGKLPTSMADPSFLGTGNDMTSAATGVYYKTANQWPWAINIAGTFIYPTEGSNISDAYPHFLDWAQSGGVNFPDWYFINNPAYRNSSKVYTK